MYVIVFAAIFFTRDITPFNSYQVQRNSLLSLKYFGFVLHVSLIYFTTASLKYEVFTCHKVCFALIL